MAVIKIFAFIVCLAFGGIVAETTDTRLKRASGGIAITNDVAPYFVSLRRNKKHVCGGAFVNPRHVVTAAHCVHDHSGLPRFNTRVVCGVDKFDEADNGRIIKSIAAPIGFRSGNSSFDIAVIALWAQVDWDESQKEIELPSIRPWYYMKTTFTAFENNFDENELHGLQQLNVNIPHVENPSLSGLEFYGTLSGQSITRADLGGPLESDNTLIGIAAKQHGDNPEACIFVNVIKFVTFIEECIENETSLSAERPSVISYAPKRPRT